MSTSSPTNEVQPTLPGIPAEPQPQPDSFNGIVVAGDLVRVSDSLKIGDHILNISAEGVPAPMAATTLAEFVATLNAAASLANLNPPALADAPSVPASPIAPPQDMPEPLEPPPGGLAAVVDQGTLAALRERGIAAPPVVAPAEPSKIVVIPAAEITQVRRTDTENGAHRVKFFTKKWHQHGIVCWEEQMNEEVTRPLEGIVDIGTLQPGTQYKCPPKIKAINVRMKTPKDGGRPTPDRVISVVV